MLTCQFCNKECKNKNSHSNHERLCPKNENRNYISYTSGKSGHVAWNKGLTKETDLRVANNANAIKVSANAIVRCKDPIKEQTRRLKISKSCKGKNGGYRENAGRSKKFRVLDSFGKETVLQSTFELRCSIILKELSINWVRPTALKYDNRNYFADFYLPEYDIWLDPKNNHKARKDKEKITKVIEQNKVKLYVLLEQHLTKEYILSLCSSVEEQSLDKR